MLVSAAREPYEAFELQQFPGQSFHSPIHRCFNKQPPWPQKFLTCLYFQSNFVVEYKPASLCQTNEPKRNRLQALTARYCTTRVVRMVRITLLCCACACACACVCVCVCVCARVCVFSSSLCISRHIPLHMYELATGVMNVWYA
jgi:hypothetical protein